MGEREEEKRQRERERRDERRRRRRERAKERKRECDHFLPPRPKRAGPEEKKKMRAANNPTGFCLCSDWLFIHCPML